MDEERFWEIIETAGKKARGNNARQFEAIKRRLGKEPIEEVVDFQRHVDQKMADSYRWDLWGAAYLVQGGCSDDGFDYFRGFLIGQGRKVYAAALADPDSLADAVNEEDEDNEFDGMLVVASHVYEEREGGEMPASKVKWPQNPRGRSWDFDNDAKMAKRFPRLWALRRAEEES